MENRNWREGKSSELIDLISGFAFKSANFLSENRENTLPIIKIKNVANGDVNLNDVVYHEYNDKLSNYVIEKGDVLIAMTGNHIHAQTQIVGDVSLCKLDDPVLLNQRVGKFVAKNDADLKFAYYLFKDEETRFNLANKASGSANQANVSKTDILDLDILIPPLPEQKAIASVLSSLDDKIDLLHQQNQTLEALAETLFRQWFIEDAKEEWEERPLSFYGKIICGKTPSKKQSSFFNGVYPFIKIPDMHGKTFVFETNDTLTEEGLKSQYNKTIPEKSINVSCIATVGLVTMNAYISQTNQQINSIIPIDVFRYYIFCQMKNSYELLQAMASGGTATPNLNTGDFSKITIPNPDTDILKKFNIEVSPIFDKIFENSKQIQILTQLRDTLLPKLMSGEVRVKM